MALQTGLPPIIYGKTYRRFDGDWAVWTVCDWHHRWIFAVSSAKHICFCLLYTSGCGACAKTGEGCFRKDVVNEFVAKAGEADGYIFGSPVHYAAASGALTSFMDRAFYSGGSKMTGKPAAAVVSCRRGGASAAFDQINKYFTINCMPVVGSQYWNQVHGGKAEEVKQDEEGMQTMRTLGICV